MSQGHLEPITNRQTWTDTFTVIDESLNPVNIAAALIEVFVRERPAAPARPWDGWDNSVSGVGSSDPNQFKLTGSTADGHVTRPGGGTDGVASFTFTDQEVRKLNPVTHEVSVYVTIAGVVSPLMIVTINVMDGVKP